ncbi:dynactin subunit 3 isoform 3-T3 [Vipera latastei]
MAVVEVQQLQSRLDALEERMFGAPAGAASAGGTRKIADGLGKVQGALGNIASKRERVKILFKKKEQSIVAQAALLEQVKSLQPYLDSAHIKASSDHATKLQRLSQIHLQQQDQCEAVTENVRLLLDDYNKLTLLLSKQFVQWDEMLTELEAAKQVKPTPE